MWAKSIRPYGVLKNALAAHKDDIACHIELGFALLMKGEFKLGFAALEMRLSSPALEGQLPDGELWDGQPLAGKTILVYQDGGLDDLVQFARLPSQNQAARRHGDC